MVMEVVLMCQEVSRIGLSLQILKWHHHYRQQQFRMIQMRRERRDSSQKMGGKKKREQQETNFALYLTRTRGQKQEYISINIFPSEKKTKGKQTRKEEREKISQTN